MQAVDNFAIKAIGLPWLELTRDSHIHERCVYLTDCVRRLGRTGLRILDVGCGSATAFFYLHSYARRAVGRYVVSICCPRPAFGRDTGTWASPVNFIRFIWTRNGILANSM